MNAFNGLPAAQRVGQSWAAYHDAGVLVRTLVAPVVNVRGIWLRTAKIWGGSSAVVLFADTAAPSSWGDTSRRHIFFARTDSPELRSPLFIPPGNGLYLCNSAASWSAAFTWDVEP